MPSQASNPFSTSFVRPGALPFRYPAGMTRDQLLTRFETNGFRGQIVGPHGVGKSSLVADLLPDWTTIFQEIGHITIRGGKQFQSELETRWLGDTKQSDGTKQRSKLIIVDGLERWSIMNRQLLIQSANQKEFGLLATVHMPIRGLPLLCRLEPRLDIFEQIVTDLCADVTAFKQDELKDVFEKADGNFREGLMLLYDQYEATRNLGVKSS